MRGRETRKSPNPYSNDHVQWTLETRSLSSYTKVIITQKYAYGCRLGWDELLQHGQSQRVQRPMLERLRWCAAHHGSIDDPQPSLFICGAISCIC